MRSWLDRLAAVIGYVVRAMQVVATATLLAAAGLNIANVVNCCCFASILIGGWSLMVLIDPNVRTEFQRQEMTTPPA